MNKKHVVWSLLKGKGLSIKKITNLAKLLYSYISKNMGVGGYPAFLMVEPTNLCNLKCPLCPTGNNSLKAPRGFMDLKNYKKIIDELQDYLIHLSLWDFGEPFLHKDIYKMIGYAKEKGIFVQISTNGHFFKNKKNIKKLVGTGIDNLIICLDGASQKTFSMYRRGGNFNTVIGNIKEIVLEKKKQEQKTPFVELQFVVMKHNEHEIPKIKKISKDIGADKLSLKTVTFDMYPGGEKKCNKYLPKDEKLSRYIRDKTGIKRKEKIRNSCLRLWFSSVINWDGSVVPCCYDPNRIWQFGNIFKEGTFKGVWNNEKYKNFRRRILTNKKAVPMCKNCTGKLIRKLN
ncbi:SPASM domain-containing protein [Candidatus Woesearchaeota archaeon]|nr:SPASM domain-containing protein [Candidatus Woesearchaeota archaeon]